ncbi:MAG: hypothetical protein ACI4RT_01815 [Candidatus Spyradenecus sp.]
MSLIALTIIVICTTLLAYLWTAHCKHLRARQDAKEKQHDEALTEAKNALEAALASHNLTRILAARARLRRLRGED